MKRILILTVALITFLCIPIHSFAITITPTPKITPKATPQITSQESEVEKIKDLVASKVAQLKLVDKRAILGTVKSASNTQITLTGNGTERIVDIDELTKFQTDDEDKSFGISDIKAGNMISVIGLYNKDTKRLLARFVELATNIPQNLDGVVAAIDLKEFTLVLITDSGSKKTISVESSTKTTSYEDGVSKKSGFSKIEVGQRLIAVGFADPKIKDQINASRIIQFVTLPPSDQMKKLQSAANENVPVSSGSAGKVQPIIK